MRKRVKKRKRCDFCKKLFHPWNYKRSRYCSYVCAISDKASIRKGKYFSCEICGKVTYRKPSHVGLAKKIACSTECAKKLKIIGNDLVCKNCGKKYHRPPSQIRLRGSSFCSRKCGGEYRSKFIVGEKSPSWKGGISSEMRRLRSSKAWKVWREGVFNRDDYRCQSCGKRNGEGEIVILHPHHLKSFAYYPDLRFSLENGQTLCISCHYKHHAKEKRKICN